MDFKEITLKNLRREALRGAADVAGVKATDIARTLSNPVNGLNEPSRYHLEIMEKAYLHSAESLMQEAAQ